MTLESARRLIEELVDRYAAQETVAHDLSRGYSEEQARVDFIDPLLKALGWDLTNEAGLAHSRREVVVEPTITGIEHQARGRPDYTLRPDGTPRLFVEAKRPALDLETLGAPAIQVRTYGWSAGLSALARIFGDVFMLPHGAGRCSSAPGVRGTWRDRPG